MAEISTVVIVSDHAYVNGGVANVAINEAVELAKLDYNVIFFSACPKPDPILHKHGVTFITLSQYDILENPNRINALFSGVYNRQAYKALSKLLLSLDPSNTVIHFHSWMKALSPLILTVPRDYRFKSILTLHDYFIACPNGGFYLNQNNQICKKVPLSFDCLTCNCDSRSYSHKLWRSVRTFVQNHIIKSIDALDGIISVSKFTAEILESYIPTSIAFKIIHNMIDVPKRRRIEVELNENLLFIGRFVQEKGVFIFAEAIAKLKKQAIFIGAGASQVTQELKNICPDAQFTGWLKPLEVEKYRKNARALIFPSNYYEANPLTPIENICRGLPVISSNANAAIEYINHGENGLLFENNSVDDLCLQISNVDSDSVISGLSKSAYNWYWKNPWSSQKHMGCLIEFYNEVLSR